MLASKDKTLLVRRNSFLVLNLAFDVVDSIARLNLESDGLASDCRRDMSVKVQVAVRVRWKVEGGVHLRVLTKICMVADFVGDDDGKQGRRYYEAGRRTTMW